MKNALELFVAMKKNYDDDEELIRDIERLSNQRIQQSLLDGAREYYAKKYNCKENEVFLGDIKFRPFYWKNGVRFPYVVVIGNVAAREIGFYAQDLKVVLGELDLTASTASIPSLTYAKRLIVKGADIKAYDENLKVEVLYCNSCKQCEQIKNCMKRKAEKPDREK